jgi:hypothetical protein
MRTSRPSPATIVAVLALVAALAGTAIAGPDATISALTRSKVKKIANKRINQLAPGLHVASADTATTANTATNANTAQNAEDADNADALGGIVAASFGSGVVLGEMQDVPSAMTGVFAPYGLDSAAAAPFHALAPVALKLRDFRAAGSGNVTGNDSLEIQLSTNTTGETTLCTVSGASPSCAATGPVSIPAGSTFRFLVSNPNGEADEDITYGYRLAP